jgi:hypothetical protein
MAKHRAYSVSSAGHYLGMTGVNYQPAVMAESSEPGFYVVLTLTAK